MTRLTDRWHIPIVAGIMVIAAMLMSGCGDSSDTSSTSETSKVTTSTLSVGDSVTKDEAGTIVTDKYGGNVISIEADEEDGRATWEVEVADSSKGRIEVDVRQDTGEMVSFERD